MAQPNLASIIIPVYNAEKYIGDCLDSCLAQTYPHIEIIVIDDGSTDDSAKIIKRYGKKIRYYHQQNGGGAVARNNGIKKARGEFLYFLDADDIVLPDAIATLVRTIGNTDLAIGNYLQLKNGKRTTICNVTQNETLAKDHLSLAFAFHPVPSTKLYRKSIIDKYKIVAEPVRVSQDLNLYYKYLLCCQKIATTTEPIYEYRIIDGSTSHSYDLRILDGITSFNGVRSFAKKLGKTKFYQQKINNVELGHLSWQIRKIWQFKNQSDKKTALSAFKSHFAKIPANKNSQTYPAFRRSILCGKLYLALGPIYTSRLTALVLSTLRAIKNR